MDHAVITPRRDPSPY